MIKLVKIINDFDKKQLEWGQKRLILIKITCEFDKKLQELGR